MIKKAFVLMAAFAVLVFVVLGALAVLQPSYAFDDDKGAQWRIRFVKIDENGEIIDGVKFRFTSSDGKGVRNGFLDTYDEIVQTQSTYGKTPSEYSRAPEIYLQANYQYFGVDNPDGSSDGYEPFRDTDAYIILEEISAPEKYALAKPVTIGYAGTDTPFYPYFNYKLIVTGEAASKTFSSVSEYYGEAFCLTEDPGGVATALFKQKYINNRRNWPEFLIVNYPEVKIAKKDTGGAYLKGAVLEITGTTKAGHAIEKKTITSTEEAVTLGLPSGTYTLHEVEPPEGYELVDDVVFTVEDGVVTVEGEEVDEVVMVDPKKEEPKPKLSVKKTSEVKKAKPGDVIPFVITVTNDGDGDADDVVVFDTMGKGLTYVSDDSEGVTSGSKVSWNVKVPAGGEKVININCRIDKSAAGKVVNNVEIEGQEEEPISGEDEFEVELYETGEKEEVEKGDKAEKEDGEREKKPEKGKDKIEDSERPVKTGDKQDLIGFALLLAASAFMLFALEYRRKGIYHK